MSSPTEVTLLLVEDSQSDAEIIERMLIEQRGTSSIGNERSLSIATVEHADTLSAGLDRIADGGVDGILLDMGLPDSKGLDTVSTVLEHTSKQPVVVLTGQKGMGVDAINCGAQDYLLKGRLTVDTLVRTISYAIERARISQNLRDRNRQLEHINEILRTELRNDMSMIIGHADGLRNRVEDDERATVDAVLEASNHALEVTDTVATVIDVIAENPRSEPRPVTLRRVLDVELERFRAAADVDLVVEWEVAQADSVTVVSIPALGKIFQQLLRNAATDTNAADLTITVTVKCTSERVSVAIADNGTGLSDTRKQQLTRSTATPTERPRTSAVWYLVRTVLDRVDGDLSIVDNDPKGTVITVHLDRVNTS